MCDLCREKDRALLSNVTPELERVLEALAAGVSEKMQRALADQVPYGLPTAVNHIIATAALMTLVESFAKTIPREHTEIATRLKVSILATSDRLKAQHAGAISVLLEALMGRPEGKGPLQ